MLPDRVPRNLNDYINSFEKRIRKLELRGKRTTVAFPATVTTYAQPNEPTGAIEEGSLWIDTDDNDTMYRYSLTPTPGWYPVIDPSVNVARDEAATALASHMDDAAVADNLVITYYQTGAPGLHTLGDLWIDSDDEHLYRWNGSSWIDQLDDETASLFTEPELATTRADGIIRTWWQFNAPTATGFGDMWVDTSKLDRPLYRWNNQSWVRVINWSLIDIAESRIKTFYDISPPTGGTYSEGDLWYDTDDNNRLYKWNGTTWLPFGVNQVDAKNVPPLDVAATVAPVSSPAVVVTGLADSFIIRAVNPPADIQLDFHVSSSAAFTPSSTTLLLGNTRETLIQRKTMPDGTPWAIETVYYFKVVAHNAAGTAPVGAESNALLQPLGPDNVSSVYVDSIISETNTVGQLSAAMALIGSLKVGTSISIDPNDGITITRSSDGKKTKLPANGSGASFIGQFLAESAEFSDNVQMKGLNNYLSGYLALASGVPNPTTKPNVDLDWSSVAVGVGAGQMGFNPTGLVEHHLGVNWLTTESLFGDAFINAVNQSNGGRVHTGQQLGIAGSNATAWAATGGITRITTAGPTYTYYVLGYDNNSTWSVKILNSSLNVTGQWTVPVSMPNGGAIGTDGTNILIARIGSGGNMAVTQHTPSTGNLQNTISCGAWNTTSITGVARQSTGFSGDTLIVSSTGGLRAFTVSGSTPNQTGTRDTSREWPRAGNSILGLTFRSGTSTWHSHDGSSVWDYTNLVGSYTSYFTWRDDNSSGSGTAETLLSDGREIVMARQRMTVSLPTSPPWDGTVDGANTARLYVKTGVGSPILQTSLIAPAQSATYTTISTTVTPGTPPGTSGFANRTGAVGSIQSTSSKTRIGGDDVTALNGTFTREASGTLSTTAGSVVTWEVFAGQVWITASSTATFATGNTTITTSQLPVAYRLAVSKNWGASLAAVAGILRVTNGGDIAILNNTGASRNGLQEIIINYPKP